MNLVPPWAKPAAILGLRLTVLQQKYLAGLIPEAIFATELAALEAQIERL